MHLGPFEELARLPAPFELLAIDEAVVASVDLAGARRARGERHRQLQEGTIGDQRPDQGGLAGARGRGDDEEASGAAARAIGVHSRFCTCSRICSISTFSSIEAPVRSMAAAFEPS